MRALALVIVLLLVPPAAAALDLEDGDRAAIREVVAAQLDAFQRDDGSVLVPTDQADFYNVVNATPQEFRQNGGGAPSHLGLLELEVTID